MNHFRVAENYADALLNSEASLTILNNIKAELEAFNNLFEEQSYREIFTNLAIDIEFKKLLITKLRENSFLSAPTSVFLCLIINNNRINILHEIVEQYIRKLAKKQHQLIAEVSSAKILAAEEISALKQLLATKFSEEIIINNVIDPQLIGGLVVRIDGWLLDWSLNSTLQNLKQRLKNTVQIV